MKHTIVNTCEKVPTWTEAERSGLFVAFCIWVFVLLFRPQDVFPVLSAWRPALLTGVLLLVSVFLNYEMINLKEVAKDKQGKLFMALLAVMIAGIPFSLYPRLSLTTVLIGYGSVIVFFFLFASIVNSLRRLSTMLLMGCLGNGLYALFSVTTGTLEGGRLYFSDMFDPNDLAFFTLSILPFNLLFISRNHPLWIRCASVGALASGAALVLMTGSRGGVLAFAAAGIALLTLASQTVTRTQKLALISAGLLIFMVSPINIDRYKTILSVRDDYNMQAETGRLELWKIGIQTMVSRPLTGVGLGCFGEAVGGKREARGAETLAWQAAHNSLIQIGSETGIVGLALFVFLSLNVLRRFNRARTGSGPDDLKKIGEMGLVGFVGMGVSGMFLSQALSTYFALYFGLSVVINRLTPENIHTKLPVRKRAEIN